MASCLSLCLCHIVDQLLILNLILAPTDDILRGQELKVNLGGEERIVSEDFFQLLSRALLLKVLPVHSSSTTVSSLLLKTFLDGLHAGAHDAIMNFTQDVFVELFESFFAKQMHSQIDRTNGDLVVSCRLEARRYLVKEVFNILLRPAHTKLIDSLCKIVPCNGSSFSLMLSMS